MSLTYLFIHLLIFSMSIMCFTNHHHHHHHRQHLKIHWNSSNRLFHSSGYLTVYLGDSIDFVCPYYEDGHSNRNIEYNTLYLVNENDYYHCNTTSYSPLIKCNKPFSMERLIYTLSISKYLPYPNIPEFDDGHYYYFISTSSGHFPDIDQRSDGLCYTKNMKLIINVQKYSRHYYEQRRKSSKLIVARRTNSTFANQEKRSSPFSSLSSTASRNFHFTVMLLVFCLLTKSKA